MEYKRFDIHQRIQHFLIMFSFLMLTFSGVPIKFSHFPWSKDIALLFGGFDNMFAVHLIGAAIMLSTCVYHLAYIIIDGIVKGKMSWAMFPSLDDAKHIAENIKYFLGKKEKPPYFDRYSYIEKFDYLAVFWGMIMIGLTGLMMWFPDVFAAFLPRWVIDVGRIAHSDEAVLAIIVIFVWHFFNVHMNPKFFPMNKVWWDGNLEMHHFKEEHPAEYARVMAAQGTIEGESMTNKEVAL